jgi:hypothetical protein
VIAMLLGAFAAAVFIATLVGDATIGASVAGVFSVINTVITAFMARRQRRLERGVRHTHRILTAPRRAVYDHDGHIVGTVLALEQERDWTGRILPPQRADDFEDPEGDGHAR